MEKTALALLFVATFIVFGITIVSSDREDGFRNIYSRAANFTAHFTASVFFKDSVTETSLKQIYAKAEKADPRKRVEKVKVLIVPGHDAQFSGTAFNGLKEVELNLALGEKLFNLLKNEPALDVFLSQTKSGYNPRLLAYFE